MEISVILNKVGSSLFPVPIEETIGMFSACAQEIKAVLESVAADGSTYRTHSNKMELMIGALKEIPVTRVLDEELPDYGLESPQAVVTCTTSKGNTHSFAIGNETVSHSEVYIRDQRNGKVMITTTGAVAQFTGSLSAYRDKEIFTIDKQNIVTVEYYQNGQHQLTVSLSI